ncbi:class I SAM-dependent methyltransferase [Jongsikchunia kroppenstedtii]|uniref:class I SAM-dependent methyltransferase n=1 Tax=Jongsikchunia kroppenstedtii TaxID=1121721 RepID=UPI0003724095|nr:class I SAM-dependent methyltransferase [Jongsikchunia kroppenstedtii]
MTSASEQARALLDPSRIHVTIDDSAGYLDILGREDELPTVSLKAMRNPVVAAIYERLWRPAFTRALSWGGRGAADYGAKLVERIGRPGDRAILDVACGPGLHTKRLAAGLTGDGISIGLDFSPPMLARAVADNSGDRVAYIRGDAHHPPFADNTFDAFVCLAALWLIPDPLTVVDQLVRVTKPGGEIAIFATVRTFVSSGPIVNFTAQRTGLKIFGRHELSDRLRSAGVVQIEQTITGETQYVIGRRS